MERQTLGCGQEYPGIGMPLHGRIVFDCFLISTQLVAIHTDGEVHGGAARLLTTDRQEVLDAQNCMSGGQRT